MVTLPHILVVLMFDSSAFFAFSGQNPENPLSLLGQYSDEETEEESAKEISHDTRENSPAELDEQVCFGMSSNFSWLWLRCK